MTGLVDAALPELGRGTRLRLQTIKGRPHAAGRGPGEPVGDEVTFQCTLLARGGGTIGTVSSNDCRPLGGVSWYQGNPGRGMGFQVWARTLAGGRVRFWFRSVKAP